MLRHALIFLIAVALASLGAVARPDRVVADDSLTVVEMCALFPTDLGLSIEGESAVSCMGWRGSLAAEGDEGTWLMGNIGAMETAAEARAEFDSSGVPTSWTPVPGLGDMAFEAYLSEFNMYVLRDRYVLYVQAATNLTDEAKALMAHLDRELAAALAGEPAEADVSDASHGEVRGGDDDHKTIDYVGVFFGSTSLKEGLEAGLDAYSACETPSDCPGVERAMAVVKSLYGTFMRDYENPSEHDLERVATLSMALGMSEIVGKDCERLFPSIATALPVIERLSIYGSAFYQPPSGGDPVPVAERLIELLAAQDAARWEDRFPQNHESIDWPPCDDTDGGEN